MWKASGKINNCRNLFLRRSTGLKQTSLSIGIHSIRSVSTGATTNGLRVGRIILGTCVSVSTIIGVGLSYAHFNKNFRQYVENSVPHSSAFFNALLGKMEVEKNYDKDVKKQTSGRSMNTNLTTVDEAEKAVNLDLTGTAPVSTVDQISISSVDIDISKAVEKGIVEAASSSMSRAERSDKEENVVVQGEVIDEEKAVLKDEIPDKQSKLSPSPVERKTVISPETDDVDVALNSTVADVSELGEKVVQLYEKAVAKVNEHCDQVKEALERFEKDGFSKEEWELLNKFHVMKNQAVSEAEESSRRLHELVDSAQAQVADAKMKGLETSAQVLSETLEKWTSAVEEKKRHLAESETPDEMMKKFHQFIEGGRENLKELVGKENMSKVNAHPADLAMLKSAQHRIRELEEKLKAREQQENVHVREALKKQEDELEKLSSMKLNQELEKLRKELNSMMIRKEVEQTERHELDLHTQLRRQAAAFTDHINDVKKIQEAELRTKYDGELREKLLLAKHESELKLRGALARLNGIISAIREQADIEKHYKEIQKLWLASQSLYTVITSQGDVTDRPYPIHHEVEYLRHVTNNDKVVCGVFDSLSHDVIHRGIYLEESLRQRFPKVKKACREVAMVGEDGGGVWSYFISYLQSLFLFEKDVFSLPSAVHHEELDTFKILSFASYALKNGDTEQAVKFMNQLRGEPRRAARDWIREARLYLEAKQAVSFLTTFALSYNIGFEQ